MQDSINSAISFQIGLWLKNVTIYYASIAYLLGGSGGRKTQWF